MTHTLRLLLAGTFGLLVALLSPQQAAALTTEQISRYLASFEMARAEFLQINPDHTTRTGTLWIHRPGRMRFEYEGRDQDLVIAGGGQLAIFDARGNAGPTQYPLRHTPVNILLERNIDVQNNRFFQDIQTFENTTVVTLQDPDRPQNGILELVFTANPVQLRQWNIQDGGGITRVILRSIETVSGIPPSHFNVQMEADRRNPPR